ncbi:MAG: hypothetical protein QW270_03490 [Candidatus Bathyarchaeia archaeon]
MQERRLLKVHHKRFKMQLKAFLKSGKALAVPVTYLILFVSLMAVISVTYSYAVVRISAGGAILRASVAKQNIQLLDDAVGFVAWSFGASQIVYMDDCGGIFHTEPTAKNLILNFTDEQSFYEVVFSGSVGKAFYELERAENYYDGFFFKGDGKPIINQTAQTLTQIYVESNGKAKVLTLCYRPLATVAVIGASGGKPLNLIRINILNLNSSQKLILREKFYLKVVSLNVTTSIRQYEFNQPISSLALKAVSDGTLGMVWLPISSSLEGAFVNLEVAICNIQISRAEV